MKLHHNKNKQKGKLKMYSKIIELAELTLAVIIKEEWLSKEAESQFRSALGELQKIKKYL